MTYGVKCGRVTLPGFSDHKAYSRFFNFLKSIDSVPCKLDHLMYVWMDGWMATFQFVGFHSNSFLLIGQSFSRLLRMCGKPDFYSD